MRLPINLPDSRYNDLLDFKPFKDVNCIISDIDGTMVSAKKVVFNQVNYLINDLQKKGVYFTVATGRTFQGAISLLKTISLAKGTILALYNGAVIMEYGTNRVIDISIISNDVIYEIINRTEKYNINVYIYSYNTDSIPLLSYNDYNELPELVYGIGLNYHAQDINGQDILWLPDKDINECKIVSVLLSIHEKTDQEIGEIITICKSFKDIRVTASGNGFIELTNVISNKGNLIEYIKKEREDTVVLSIGDNDNDRELFTKSDISVGVRNSSNNIYEVIDYITDRDNVEGFIDILTTVRNAKLYL